jgi:hypothetical protein
MNEAAALSRYFGNLESALKAAKEFDEPEFQPKNILEEIIYAKPTKKQIIESIKGNTENLQLYHREDRISEAERSANISVEAALRKIQGI